MTADSAGRRRAAASADELELVYGLHPVMELLSTRRRQVERILVAKDRTRGFGRALREARDAGIPVSHLSLETFVRKVGRRAVHQGIAAQVAPVAYAEVGEVCEAAAADPAGMLVLVDRVVDPRNLGAILRTCAGAAVRGVLLGGDGTVGLTPVVAKASAGSLERVPVAREPRPARRLESLRQQGFTAVALDPHAGVAWDQADLTGRIVFVAGGEEKGARPGVVAACDRAVSIPLGRGSESLNVAVALGVLLFEAVRQRRAARSGP